MKTSGYNGNNVVDVVNMLLRIIDSISHGFSQKQQRISLKMHGRRHCSFIKHKKNVMRSIFSRRTV